MSKIILVKGDHVSAKKWSGEEFLGIFEYSYADGSHCIVDVKTNCRFNVKARDARMANDEEEKVIKQALKEKKILYKVKLTEMTIQPIANEELEAALASTEE